MTIEPNVLKARSKMIAAMDKKLKNDPTWQAFRAIDDLFISSLNGAVSRSTARESGESHRQKSGPKKGSGGSLGDLGVAAIREAGKPIMTDALVAYVATRRQLNPDPKRARINVQSAMSHDERIMNIKWRGGSAWWLKGQVPPTED